MVWPGNSAGLAVALGLVLLERIGKAVRSPARSQLVATAARSLGEGKGFGLDEALDQIGAVSGPLLCGLVMWLAAGQGASPLGRYRWAFVVLALPWLVNGLLILRARRQPLPSPAPAEEPAELASLGGALRLYLIGLALLAAGFVDWALVGLHISRGGVVPPAWTPFLYAFAMATDGLTALVLGALFDRWSGRRGVLTLAIGGLLAAGAAPLLFLQLAAPGSSSAKWLLGIGVALWGAAMGAQESVCKAAIARFVPSSQRARAYGTFYALFGISWWIGSSLLGLLYDHSRPLLVAATVTAQLLAVLILSYVATTKPTTP
jgi:MFS family permease